MKNLKQNLVFIGGNVSFIDIKESTAKPGEYFGSVNVAYDDGYYDKGNSWVERVSFIDIKMTNHAVKQLSSTLNVGDQITFEGKLVVEKWNDKDDNPRKAMKVEAIRIISHITKEEIDALKSVGLIGNKQSENNA